MVIDFVRRYRTQIRSYVTGSIRSWIHVRSRGERGHPIPSIIIKVICDGENLQKLNRKDDNNGFLYSVSQNKGILFEMQLGCLQ